MLDTFESLDEKENEAIFRNADLISDRISISNFQNVIVQNLLINCNNKKAFIICT